MDIKVQVVGMGYIGLPTSICLAECFDYVHGCDIDSKKIEKISQYDVDKNEPFLIEKLKKVLPGSLSVSNECVEADVHIICVPTPFNKDKSPNLQFIFDALEKLSSLLKKNDLIILESTSPIGTTEKIKEFISKKRDDFSFTEKDSDIYIAYCPERVLPGNIFDELYNNNRVLGGINKISAQKASKLYKTFVKGSVTLTDSKTAEFIKLAENTYRDINIAIANEFSMMAFSAGLNINDVIEITNQHPRVNILSPGTGVGGHCLAVDPYFLINSFPDYSLLTSQARKVNLLKEEFSFSRIKSFIDENNLKEISIFGLSYKANSNDLRESPSFRLFQKLVKEDIFIYVCEPNIDEVNFRSDNFKIVDFDDALKKGQGLIFLVSHDEFIDPLVFESSKPLLNLCNLDVKR